MGIDGFRVDALPFIMEDMSFNDEPLIKSNVFDDHFSYILLNHIYSRDQPGTYKIVEEFRSVFDEYKKKDGHTRYWHEKKNNFYSLRFKVFKTIIYY